MLPPDQRRRALFSETRMMGAKQPAFCGAVARALLIGVEIGGLDGMRVGSGSKMGKLQYLCRRRRFKYDIIRAVKST